MAIDTSTSFYKDDNEKMFAARKERFKKEREESEEKDRLEREEKNGWIV